MNMCMKKRNALPSISRLPKVLFPFSFFYVRIIDVVSPCFYKENLFSVRNDPNTNINQVSCIHSVENIFSVDESTFGFMNIYKRVNAHLRLCFFLNLRFIARF